MKVEQPLFLSVGQPDVYVFASRRYHPKTADPFTWAESSLHELGISFATHAPLRWQITGATSTQSCVIFFAVRVRFVAGRCVQTTTLGWPLPIKYSDATLLLDNKTRARRPATGRM